MVGPTGSEEHAWNQVEIDEGKWIEVDSTWDHNHGTDYIGTDKQKFCKEHGRTIYSPLAIINTEEHIVSELDLNGFINSELGLPSNYSYSKEEQVKLIELIETRDIDRKDIKTQLEKTLESRDFRIKSEQEFEQECGYSIDDLKNLGFPNDEIIKMECKFNGRTGERLDRKAIVEQKISQKNLPKAYNGASIKQSDIRESYDILSKTKTELEHSKAEDLTYDR